MVDTVTILLDRHFSVINRQDGDVVTSVPVDDAAVAAVAGVPGSVPRLSRWCTLRLR